ncbi:MAG: hypothetical protein GC158_16125 [Cyanobacteria bacterium RI_101]|nr:hypothetical protein [Cyanobacteria bacterium RI_101]
MTCVEAPKTETAGAPLANLRVNVGVDASESMLGYAANPASRYAQAINALHTLLQTQGSQTRYWRVGGNESQTQAQSVTAAQFLQARTPAFYCDRNQPSPQFPCVTSTLGQIYSLPQEASPSPEPDSESPAPAPQTLTVLITDLEPDAAAVGDLSGKISAQLRANPDYKVVLLGVRSEFDGNLFPAMSGAFPATRYQVNRAEVETKGRPFFVLMSGPQGAVDALVKEFRRLPLDVNRSFRAASFAINAQDTVTLDRSAVAEKINNCVSQSGALNRQRPAEENQWLLLEQDGAQCEGEQSLTLKVPSRSSPTLAGGDLTEAELKPELFAVSQPWGAVEKAAIKQDQLILNLRLDGQKLPPKKGEALFVTLPRRELDRAVWQDWDTDVAQPDGARTQNLLLFVSGLRGAVERESQNKDGDLAAKYCLGLVRYP